ncbi:MAG TPA: serine hydrolase domain-containing protein [Polyangia bacterium]|nr:serine hydrolase domain-containing protein [Polyangia bacterium]
MPNTKLNPLGGADLHAVMAGHVARGEVPGLVALVARGDDVQVAALGTMVVGGREPMRRDTLFRIASITKPIAAAATMILVDDGLLRLDDSVERWLPELANRRVLRRIDAELDDTVPARRAITVYDLPTSCLGFGSVMAPPDTYPIQRPIRDGHLGGDGHPHPSLVPDTDEWMRRVGALPLMYQPGERFLYNASCDLMGVLVARASGGAFSAFLGERLFGPLGMKDTGFWVPPSELGRLAGCYRFDRESRSFEVFDGTGQASDWSRPPPFESGAAGLVSTADDYFAFCRMLLNGGVAGVGGARLLTQASVAAMTRDHLTPEQKQGAEIFFGNHSGWGFGMAVNVRSVEGEPWVVPGRFGWDGGYGTTAYSDPKNDLVGILLTQRLMDSPEPPAVFREFWAGAYGG